MVEYNCQKFLNNFAIESCGNPYTAIGIHGTDKYYCSSELFIKIFKSL